MLWLKSKGISEDFLLELPPNLRGDILFQKYHDSFKANHLLTKKGGEVDKPLIKSMISLLEFRIY